MFYRIQGHSVHNIVIVFIGDTQQPITVVLSHIIQPHLFCNRCTCISLGDTKCVQYTRSWVLCAQTVNVLLFKNKLSYWDEETASWFELIWAKLFPLLFTFTWKVRGPNLSYWNNKQQQYLWLFGIATHFNLQSDIHTTSQAHADLRLAHAVWCRSMDCPTKPHHFQVQFTQDKFKAVLCTHKLHAYMHIRFTWKLAQ